MLKEAIAFLGEDFKAAEAVINNNIHSTIKVIPDLSNYILESGGKRFRPVLLMLSASLCGYRGRKAHVASAVVEYIHTATLLHDDVVDEADMRRGQAAAKTIWGNEASVLVGDYLFARSFQMMVHDCGEEVLKIMSGACISLAEGEILQLINSFNPNIAQREYYRTIYGKTAALISACCEVGAVLAGAPESDRHALKEYGEDIGFAFQIVDDCLDITGDPKRTGKPLGIDLKEGKITLPVILTMESAKEKGYQKDLETIKEVVLSDDPAEDFTKVKEIVERHRGVEKSIEIAWRHVNHAITRIENFRDCPEKEYLKGIASFIVERDF